MSSISSVAAAANSYQSILNGQFGQMIQDFSALGSALQSGNMTTAQTALASFKQDLSSNTQNGVSAIFGNNTQANTDFQSLINSLQSGDMTSAQKAFSSLVTDMKSAYQHGAATSTTATSASGSGTSGASSAANAILGTLSNLGLPLQSI